MFFTYMLHLPELKYLYYTVHVRKTKYVNKKTYSCFRWPINLVLKTIEKILYIDSPFDSEDLAEVSETQSMIVPLWR